MDNQCEFCKKEFSSKSSLVYHQSTAKYCLKLQGKTNNRFVCDFCQKSFTIKQAYQEHLLICKNKSSKEIKQDEKEEKKYNELRKTNTELISKIKDQEQNIQFLKEMLYKANQTIAEIAKQPKITNNDNRNNINNITNIFDINNTEKIETILDKYLTPEVLIRGQEGVADMLNEHLLKSEDGTNSYGCTNISRQIFEFRNMDGNIEKDPKAIKLINNLSRSGIYDKTHNTGKKLWENNDGSVNSTAQEAHLPRVMEALEIDKGDSSKFRSRLACVTYIQKK